MAIIANNLAISLRTDARQFRSTVVPLHPQADVIEVRLARPTTLNPLSWPANATVQVAIVLMVDGVEYRCTGSASGGIRADQRGEIPFYRLAWSPAFGFFGDRSRPPRWLGEGKAIYTVHTELIWLAGSIETVLDMSTREPV